MADDYTPRPQPLPTGDVFLDYDGVVSAVERLGRPRPTRVAVIGWADRRLLPFFRHLDGRRYISRHVLTEWLRAPMGANDSILNHFPTGMAMDDVYLDFEGIRNAVAELGFPKPELVTVIGWADRKVLPFFKGLDGKRYISRRALITFFSARQAEAVRAMGRPKRR